RPRAAGPPAERGRRLARRRVLRLFDPAPEESARGSDPGEATPVNREAVARAGLGPRRREARTPSPRRTSNVALARRQARPPLDGPALPDRSVRALGALVRGHSEVGRVVLVSGGSHGSPRSSSDSLTPGAGFRMIVGPPDCRGGESPDHRPNPW